MHILNFVLSQNHQFKFKRDNPNGFDDFKEKMELQQILYSEGAYLLTARLRGVGGGAYLI